MIQYNKTALCFDDILLVPQSSKIMSRHEVDTTMVIGSDNRSISLRLPVIAAPMDTVCDINMCMAMSKFGGLGILHRYMPYDDQIRRSMYLIDVDTRFGVAISSNNGFLDHAQNLYRTGVRILLVDTANGHGSYAVDAVKALRDKFDDVHIMSGNVATAEGFANLAKAGADSVRVGIGGGSACTTRIVSGHGVPTLSSIIDVDEWRDISNSYGCSIVADGGIRNSGDMVKSFAAGADAVMIGSMLAGTDEAPGDILTDANGHQVKMFRGMASADAQKDSAGRVSVAEGISTNISYRGSVSHILTQIKGGIGSGCSYSGCESLSDLSAVSEYVEVTANSINESKPHAL